MLPTSGPVVTTEQAIRVVARLERYPLTPRQLRLLEVRRCVVPRALTGARGPRVYDVGDVMLLRLLARLQADDMLARWQGWAVVAQLREPLKAALVSRLARALVVRGGAGEIVPSHRAASMLGVVFDLQTIADGVRDAMRAESGDVWNGAGWVTSRQAAALAVPVDERKGRM